ncbi:hypothetical protein IQ61_04955 [Streptomyces scabiei]|nr:hypothetical protein IQ61_04955 [Streptomyces scabiei]
MRDPEERGGLAAGSRHVVDLLERAGPAERRTGQTALPPEGGRVVGDDLGDGSHPDRGGPGQAYEVGGERVAEVDALQGEGRRDGQDDVLGVERTGRGEHVEAVLAVRVDGGDGRVQSKRTWGQRCGEGAGDALGPGGETTGGGLDQVAGEAARAGRLLKHRVACEVLVEGLEATAGGQGSYALLSVPEPGVSQVEGPPRAFGGGGEQACADAVARLEGDDVTAGGTQRGGRRESGGAGADHDDVVAVLAGHVWLHSEQAEPPVSSVAAASGF